MINAEHPQPEAPQPSHFMSAWPQKPHPPITNLPEELWRMRLMFASDKPKKLDKNRTVRANRALAMERARAAAEMAGTVIAMRAFYLELFKLDHRSHGFTDDEIADIVARAWRKHVINLA